MIKPGIARTIRRAILRVLPTLLLVLAFLSLVWLILAAPASAEQTDENPTDTKDTQATAYPIGIFITSLHDLDITGGSFGVTYWV